MDTERFFEDLSRLDQLMRWTLERWALSEVPVECLRDGTALADRLRDEYLIDHETHESLQRLRAWAVMVRDRSTAYSQKLLARGLLDELLALFKRLANGPTLGKRHDAIIAAWMAGESVAELAEHSGRDEQRTLVLLYEVVRYYEVGGVPELKVFLASRMA